MTAISVGDNLWGLIDQYHYTWCAALIRPFYLVLSIRVLRIYCVRYLLVIKDSTPMVLFIIFYILYFSSMGQRYFAGTLEGVVYFPTFADSIFHMLVLMSILTALALVPAVTAERAATVDAGAAREASGLKRTAGTTFRKCFVIAGSAIVLIFVARAGMVTILRSFG